jgi:hypothetical protein
MIGRKFEDNNLNGDARVMNLLTSLFGGAGGSQSIVGVFGDSLVAQRFPLFSANFAYPANTKTVVSQVVGSGTVDYDLNMLRVSTGITTESSACIRTKRQLRYTAGRDAEAMATAVFSPGVEGTYQRFGLIDEEDGLWIGIEGTSFACGRRKDTGSIIEEEIILQNDFNGDKLDGTGYSGFTIDTTKMNIFRINYGYLGTAEIKYQIQISVNGVTQFVTFHTIDRRNEYSETHLRLPYLPLCMRVNNGETTENMSMKVGSLYAGVFDGVREDRAARRFSADVSNDVGVGIDNRVAIFHNKATFHGLENHIESNLIYFTAGVQSQSNKTITIDIYRLPNQTQVDGVWNDVDSDNSTFEYSVDETINLTDRELLISFALSPSDSIREFIKDLFVNALPDDYIGITVSSAGASEVRLTFRWEELF